MGGIYNTPKLGCTQNGQTAGTSGEVEDRLSCKKHSVQINLSQHRVLFMLDG